jgi:hypothetical protein
MRTNSISTILLFLAVVLPWPGYSKPLKPLAGIYFLTGKNPQGSKSYYGAILIAPQKENYKLTWIIGDNQSQVGVGLLQDRVLSVGYGDTSGQDFGVVSFVIKNSKRIEGRWSSLKGESVGFEELDYLGPNNETTMNKLKLKLKNLPALAPKSDVAI